MGEPTTTSTFANDTEVSQQDPDLVANDEDVVDSDVDNDSDSVDVSDTGDNKVDLGNHEADDDYNPPTVNDEGKLVDSDGNTVFTTTEQAIADGSFVLDAKGRMPGLYLDDLELLQRRNQSEAIEAAFGAASEGKNSVVERQVNVANSGLPPVTVKTSQEHPITGDAKDDDAEVPLLEKNPFPAE